MGAEQAGANGAMRDLGLLGLVLLSLAAGWIAARVVRSGLGLFDGLVIGALGLMLGAAVAQALDLHLPGLLGALAVSTAGAIAVAGLLALLRPRRRR